MQVFLVIAIVITFLIAIDGWRRANIEAKKSNSEASETIAKLVLKVMYLEGEMALLKSENAKLRARVIELESKLPNEK